MLKLTAVETRLAAVLGERQIVTAISPVKCGIRSGSSAAAERPSCRRLELLNDLLVLDLGGPGTSDKIEQLLPRRG